MFKSLKRVRGLRGFTGQARASVAEWGSCFRTRRCVRHTPGRAWGFTGQARASVAEWGSCFRTRRCVRHTPGRAKAACSAVAKRSMEPYAKRKSDTPALKHGISVNKNLCIIEHPITISGNADADITIIPEHIPAVAGRFVPHLDNILCCGGVVGNIFGKGVHGWKEFMNSIAAVVKTVVAKAGFAFCHIGAVFEG